MKGNTPEQDRADSESNLEGDIVPYKTIATTNEDDAHWTARVAGIFSSRTSDGFGNNHNQMTLFWSCLAGSPLIAAAAIILTVKTPLPSSLAYPPLIVGIFVWVGGLLTQYSSPPLPQTYENEVIIATTTPTRRVAAAKNIVGTLFLGIGTVLLVDVTVPLAYPISVLLVGAYFYSAGIFQFWVHSLTRYFLTTQRFIQSYQLLSIKSKSLPLSQVQAMEQSRSFVERLFGIGHVAVEAAGDTRTSRILARHIEKPNELAEGIQSRIQDT